MSLPPLRDFTTARVDLGRAGHSLRTGDLLALQLAHARARDAVHKRLDVDELGRELSTRGRQFTIVRSAATDRSVYLSRPDLGRRLAEESRAVLAAYRGPFDVVFVVADGLSAVAVERHAIPLLDLVCDRLPGEDWKIAPVTIVEQGRVAIGDEVGECMGASQAVVLIGERPGLSSPASLGVYLSWGPRVGLTDVDRNCISNIHEQGLSHEQAANKLIFLMTEARRRKLSGIELKEDAMMLSQGSDLTIRAALPDDMDTIRSLLREYGRYLAESLPEGQFRESQFEEEIASLPFPYVVLLLAYARTGESEKAIAGCLLLKEISPERIPGAAGESACEMKRLWVRPGFRRLGIGEALAKRMISEATELGYRAVYLDTVPSVMGAAVHMYEKLSFRSVERYNDNPISGAAFFRRTL